MTLHVALTHRTAYRYDRPIVLGPQIIRLRPAPHSRTPMLSYSLKIEPPDHFLNWQQDPQGNFLARVVFPERVTQFAVTVDLVADMATINPFDFFLEPEAEEPGRSPMTRCSIPNLPRSGRRKRPGPLLNALLAGIARDTTRTVPMLVALNALLRDRVDYIVRHGGRASGRRSRRSPRAAARAATPPGCSCRSLRHLGLAARFVSGYLIQLKPDPIPRATVHRARRPISPICMPGRRCICPGAGWVGLRRHLRAAGRRGPHPARGEPGAGVGRADQRHWSSHARPSFDFAMSVTRIAETPAHHSPIREPVWQAILAMGAARSTARSTDGDVRLTMGGEPTFISRNRHGCATSGTPTRSGPTKRPLRRQADPQAAAALGAGCGPAICASASITPASSCRAGRCTRTGGVTASRSGAIPSLLASDDDDGQRHRRRCRQLRSRTAPSACRSIRDRVLPAYEDIHYYLWREHRLPANVVAEDAKLADPLERARLARVFGQGLDARGRQRAAAAAGRRSARPASGRWQTGRWLLRSDLLFLVPGDSADRLPAAAAEPALGRPASHRDRARARPVRAAGAAAAAQALVAAAPGRLRRDAGPAWPTRRSAR